jgi:lysine N6-hydroxylase
VLGTGYRFRPPDFLAGVRERINWTPEGRYKVARNCSIDTQGGEIFVLNAEIHADAYLPADLGQGAYRSSVVLREITGREVYPVEKSIAFQRFAAPAGRAGPAAAAGSA